MNWVAHWGSYYRQTEADSEIYLKDLWVSLITDYHWIPHKSERSETLFKTGIQIPMQLVRQATIHPFVEHSLSPR